jgi:U3 small nucleolar ribonucleoprotein protein IMP4
MKITTARKPSSKTRIFCKHLGRFTGWAYITRGKSSLKDFADKPFLLVGESRGNPGNFSFFLNGKCVLSIRANVTLDTDIGVGVEPTIQGNSPIALDISKITGLKICQGSERVINVEKNIEFTCEGKSIIKLTVLEIRSEGSA